MQEERDRLVARLAQLDGDYSLRAQRERDFIHTLLDYLAPYPRYTKTFRKCFSGKFTKDIV